MDKFPLEKSVCFSNEKIKKGITLECVPYSEPKTESIPEALRAIPHWVLWGVQRRGEKITKPPLYVCDGRPSFSSVDAPAKWHSFPEALQALAQWRGKIVSLGGGTPLTVAGVGFVLTGDFTGVDIDHCTAPDGTIYGWARPLVQALKLAGYVERSPSGTGIRAFTLEPLPEEYAEGGHPEGVKWNDGTRGIEVYRGRRYLTVTGRKLEGANPEPLQDNMCAPALSLLWAYIQEQASRPQREEVKDAPRGVQSDDDLLQKAFAAKKGDDIRALYCTPPREGEDASVEDQRLASYLAFWAGGDADTLDRLMRGSARLHSPERLKKWESRHSSDGRTYGDMTIAKALKGLTRTYDGGSTTTPKTATEGERDVEPDSTLSLMPEVPRGIFPAEVEDALDDIAAKMTGGLYAVAFAGFLAGVAAAVRAKRSIAVFNTNPQPLIFWICNIAPSGSGKTGAAEVWTKPVLAADKQAQAAYDTAYADYAKSLAAWKSAPKKERGDEPTAPDYPPVAVMQDTTLEALGDVLKTFSRAHKTPCTTLVCDELRMGLRSLDCYSGGKDGGASPQLLSRYDMAPWTNRRLMDSRRNFTLLRAGVSIYGGLQPRLIQSVFTQGMIDSGGFGRWAFCLSSAPEHKTAQMDDLLPETKATVQKLMGYLLALPEPGDGGGIVQTTPEARALFVRWYDALHSRLFAEARTEFVDKLSKLASRLALAIHLVQMAVSDTPSDMVDASTIDKAIRLTDDYFRRTQKRVLAYALGKGAVVQPRDRTAARIILSHREEIDAAAGRVSSKRLLQWLTEGGLVIRSDKIFGAICKALQIGVLKRTSKERYREITEVALVYMQAITSQD